ncbi:MAG: response regulator [Vicinamibacterales bacterium]
MAHILLLAEPSLTIQRVVQLTFANEDIDVVVASDGAEALEQAERLRPAVVLADVALARMNGYDLAAQFKRDPRFAGVPVVLLSGAFERVDTVRATASGCDLVLSKPFEPRHLLAHVKGLLAGAAVAGAPQEVAPHEAAPVEPAGFSSPAQEPPPAPPAPPPAAASPDADPSGLYSMPRVGDLTLRRPPPAADPAPVPPPAVLAAEPPAEPVSPPPSIPAELPPVLADRMRPGSSEAPRVTRRPAEPPPPMEPVPSFEMLALTNKAMRLVPPPSVPDEPDPEPDAVGPAPEPVPANRGAGHDLGDLIPSLDDYFDQLDAAFASGGDTSFRRAPDAPPPEPPPPPRAPQRRAAPPPPEPPAASPAVPVPPPGDPLMPPPPQAFVERRKTDEPRVETAEDRGPAVSPFSTLRLEPPDPRPAPAASVTIDDAYDALMKQLQEPKQRPSVVALRADDELLVERAVERVLAQLDTAAVRDAMSEVVTTLTKKVIAEEIERIRRP